MTTREKDPTLELVIKNSAGFGQVLTVVALALLLGVTVFAAGQKTGFFNRAARLATKNATKRVQVLIFNPIVNSATGQKLIDY